MKKLLLSSIAFLRFLLQQVVGPKQKENSWRLREKKWYPEKPYGNGKLIPQGGYIMVRVKKTKLNSQCANQHSYLYAPF